MFNKNGRYYNHKIRKFERTVHKSNQKFCWDKEGEIGLEQDPSLDGYAFICFNHSFSPKRRNPRVIVGRIFLGLDDREKEAILAHELGHYCKVKNYSVRRLERVAEWVDKSRYYTERHLWYSMLKHKIERLQKWNNLKEIDADNLALKAGYGSGLLKFLKKFYEKNDPELDNKMLHARIKNLESKLS